MGGSIVTLTDCPKSVRNRCVFETFDGVFVLSRWFLAVDVVAFVIGLSQISSYYIANTYTEHGKMANNVCGRRGRVQNECHIIYKSFFDRRQVKFPK